MGNPILDELSTLSPGAKSALIGAHQQATNPLVGMQPPNPAIAAAQHPQGAPPPSIQAPSQSAGPAAIGSAPQPAVKAPLGTVQGDENERGRLLNSGSGISQIKNPFLKGLAETGDTIGHVVAPGVMRSIPGTEEHHQQLIGQNAGTLGIDQRSAQDQATLGHTQASTNVLNAQPELNQAKLDLQQNKADETENHHQTQIEQQLAQHGFKTDETGKIVPLPYGEMSETQQAVHDLKGAQEEEQEATAALKKVQADPNSPQARAAQQRINNAQQAHAIALQRLGLSEKTFDARYHGTEGGQALPGAMLTDSGQPVGSAFSANVRPTGTERNKADLANSASAQINDMKAIITKHPEFFGPGYGQSTEFKRWIGSQDPDAQRFVAARTIAGDHLAGTFGGRSEAALNALDKALGQFKDNPKAAMAGLDQLAGANKSFQKAGTVRTVGSNADSGAPKEGDSKVNSAGDKVVFKGGKWGPA